jgi:hypothetical protein
MGYAKLSAMTNVQVTGLIRKLAKNTEAIFFVDHAQDRMLQRGIGIEEVYCVLREGLLERPWKINKKHDTFEARMERYVGGRELAVVVTLDDDSPDVLVITAMIKT